MNNSKYNTAGHIENRIPNVRIKKKKTILGTLHYSAPEGEGSELFMYNSWSARKSRIYYIIHASVHQLQSATTTFRLKVLRLFRVFCFRVNIEKRPKNTPSGREHPSIA